jgi:hypothetical protein
MSGESSRMVHDVTLTGRKQIEMHNIIRENTAAMNKEQLRTHIQEVIRALVALSQLPTTSRLHELLKAKQSANDAEAWTSALEKELALTQQKLKEIEEKTPECDHRELEGKIRGLEEQWERRAPDQIELAWDLEVVLATGPGYLAAGRVCT